MRAHYNPNQPRGPGGRWGSGFPGVRKVKRHVNRSVQGRAKTIRLECGPVSPANISRVRQGTGLDLTGYRRVMDSGDVRHALKQHGSAIREAARTPPQLPIRPADFARIGVIAEHGTLTGMRRPKRGAPTLTHTAVLGRVEYTLVEQVRAGTKQVALKSLWKRRL